MLSPNKETKWEGDLNRPVVLKRDNLYHMWYTGFDDKGSYIGYATSADGVKWKRMSDKPVMIPEMSWEKECVMCPHVNWDEQCGLFKMWYSAGERNEPNAIGYATSRDGIRWTKHDANPVFVPDKTASWERHKVTACHVTKRGEWYVMFYIGFRDEPTAAIGIARSKDGVTGWQRHPANPIVRPSKNGWDASACYKPSAILDGDRWLLWYNGRHGAPEQIGLATHEGSDLGFESRSTRQNFLNAEKLRHYVDEFNCNDQELYVQHVPNAKACEFLEKNVPLFECPDKEIEETYYFRWWSYRKHIKKTHDGFVVTEFLPPVGWGGKHNTICCPAGHHLYEGRWLKNPSFLDDYSMFWFRRGGNPRQYSFWTADAIWARLLVNGRAELAKNLLPDLIRNFQGWEKDRRDANGLFWQEDGLDGMEVSIGGSGYRATINSYMYGDAMAIANIANLAGSPELAKEYREKAARIKELSEKILWDNDAQFFKVLPRGKDTRLADVRELHGFTPWYFNLPDSDKSAAWKQIVDPHGFYAPFGPTTAEQRHPRFAAVYQGHECQWNGPSWPYATAITLTAMANLLNNYKQSFVTRADYFDGLKIYAKSHHRKTQDGKVVSWIDENLHPQTGDWISRTLLQRRKQPPNERGKDYNHSTFCDLIITGLVGLRPRADNTVEVHPLLPDGKWDWFCLDRVSYHGHVLTILYDRTGRRYNVGTGLRVLIDGRTVGVSETLTRIAASIEEDILRNPARL